MGGTTSTPLASAPVVAPSSGSGFSVISIIFLLLGLVAIYYMYRFLYTSSSDKQTPLVTQQRAADSSPSNLPLIPVPYEGGEYSVNMWVYVNSFNKNRNTRKHLFELQGQYFSTLLIGLGAFNNTLMVRTHTKDPSSEGFQDKSKKAYKVIEASEGFQNAGSGTGSGTGSGMPMVIGGGGSGPGSGAGSGAGSGPGPGSVPAAAPPSPNTVSHSAVPPNAGTSIGNLSATSVNTLFTPLAMDDALLNSPPMCDLPEIDMQRWTMITVVLSGRTSDV